MKCLINEDGTVKLKASENLEPTESKCVFSVKACGVCGSDIPRVFSKSSYYYPIILGHEFAGEVKKSNDLSIVGKRACVYPILPCGKCDFCKKQQWANCTDYSYYGSRCDGGMQSDLLINESNLISIPDNVSFEEAAMVEPAAVCLHAVKKADIAKGSSMLIYGAGTIGLLSGMWARAFGAEKIYFSEPNKDRIKMAEELGFSAYIGGEVDAVIEASGTEMALCDAIKNCRSFGKIVLVGHGTKDVTIGHQEFVKILRKQLTLVGSWNSDRNDYIDDWTESISAISEKKINPQLLITHKIPLEKAPEAFEIIKERKETYNKIMLVM